MAASAAGVFAEGAAPFHERDPVAQEDAPHRMANKRLRLGVLHERVAAAARVFRAAAPLGDAMHAMAEEPAEVAHLFVEDAAGRIRIGILRKQERVAAADAGVFGVAVPLSDALVGVVDEEAPERVANAHHGAVIAQHRTAAARACPLTLLIHLVLHRVSPDPARESRQHELTS